MKVCAVVIDSQPGYLPTGGPASSLLLAPLGAGTVIQHVRSCLAAVTRNALIIVPQSDAHPDRRRVLAAACPTARVLSPGEEMADALRGCEPSDALLIVDPRCLPVRESEISSLVNRYALDARVTHHLVAFESAIAGTKERVAFDANGQVRGVLRYYDGTTWPFIAGIAATVLPVSSGILGDGCLPTSLAELRRIVAAYGVPGCDVAIEGASFDLNEEAGFLGANEHFIVNAAERHPRSGRGAVPLYIGGGQAVHASVRLAGPIVIHADVRIDEHVTVLGPAVIAAGAHIGANTVIAQAAIGPGAEVPPGQIVRDTVWFDTSARGAAAPVDRPAPAQAAWVSRAARDLHRTRLARQHGGAHLDLRLKRWLDVAVAVIGLILLAPLLALIAIVVRLESPGPSFYGDQREGLKGRRFRCWKFRTMYAGAHAAQTELKALDHTDGPHFKIDSDPRVTRVGRILRATNLDEIPQLFNVVAGTMSLVGPRPSPFRENQICVPWRDARLSVPPGITGLWQVCRHDRSAGDFHQWIEYDLMYVQHLSFWLDLKILVATLFTLGGKVACAPVGWLVPSGALAMRWRALLGRGRQWSGSRRGRAHLRRGGAGDSPAPPGSAAPADGDRPTGRSVHVPELDGVRGVAIAAVMALHFVGGVTATNLVERTAAKVTSYGVWGVDLFFVLSGFLITGILFETKDGPRYFRDFYMRRALRIFPLYYGVLIVMLVLIPASPLARWDPALLELRSLQGWIWPYLTNVYLGSQESFSIPYLSHLWSLAIEEHFYLLWPLLIFVLSRTGAMRLCVALGLLSLGLRIWFSFTAPNLLAVQTLTPLRLDALCAGSWFALSARGHDALSPRRALGWLVASGAAILAVSVAHVLMPQAQGLTLPTRTFLLAVFFGLFIYAVTRHSALSLFRVVLRAQWLRTLGKYSYGLYVFHGIVAYAMAYASPEAFLTRMVGLHVVAAALQIAFAFTVSMLLAVASYELFERRFLMLKKRFDYAGAAPAAAGRERAVTGLVPTT